MRAPLVSLLASETNSSPWPFFSIVTIRPLVEAAENHGQRTTPEPSGNIDPCPRPHSRARTSASELRILNNTAAPHMPSVSPRTTETLDQPPTSTNRVPSPVPDPLSHPSPSPVLPSYRRPRHNPTSGDAVLRHRIASHGMASPSPPATAAAAAAQRVLRNKAKRNNNPLSLLGSWLLNLRERRRLVGWPFAPPPPLRR
ncbi:hypothetical protein IWZ00DRAFT_490197 [Phyllosticta capitalensis]